MLSNKKHSSSSLFRQILVGFQLSSLSIILWKFNRPTMRNKFAFVLSCKNRSYWLTMIISARLAASLETVIVVPVLLLQYSLKNL